MPNLNNKDRTTNATSNEINALNSLTGAEPIHPEYIPAIDLSNLIDKNLSLGLYQKTGIKGRFTQTIFDYITENITLALNKIFGNSTTAKNQNKLSTGLLYHEDTSQNLVVGHNPNSNQSYTEVSPHPRNYRRYTYSKIDVKEILKKSITKKDIITFNGLNSFSPGAAVTNDTINYIPGAVGALTVDQKLSSYNPTVGYVSHRFEVPIEKGHDLVDLLIETYMFLGSNYIEVVLEYATDSSYSTIQSLKLVTFGLNQGNAFAPFKFMHLPSLTWGVNETVKPL